MAVQQTQRIQDLESSFDVFNKVSQKLEISYNRLEDRVTRLHGELVANIKDKQSQENHQENQHLRSILTALPAGVVVLDGRGRIQQCNPVASQILGEPLSGEIWANVIKRAFAPRSDDGHEISLRDGRRVSISTCPLDGVPGQVLLITDVTQTRELQNNVSQHQRLMAMGEMAAGLAHQIRTPLASSLLFVSQLKNKNIDSEKRINVADKVMQQLRQLESLIEDMLMFSRTGYSGEEIISVESLVKELENTVLTVCETRDINIVVKSHSSGLQIKGNPRILSSALLNLAMNAIQAMGNKGTLELHVDDGICDTVEISIVDDGPGISQQVKEKLFQPFFTTRLEGTGLGLAVTQAIVRAHGGVVIVDSEEGKGSRFTVQLPIANTADTSQVLN